MTSTTQTSRAERNPISPAVRSFLTLRTTQRTKRQCAAGSFWAPHRPQPVPSRSRAAAHSRSSHPLARRQRGLRTHPVSSGPSGFALDRTYVFYPRRPVRHGHRPKRGMAPICRAARQLRDLCIRARASDIDARSRGAIARLPDAGSETAVSHATAIAAPRPHPASPTRPCSKPRRSDRGAGA